MPLYLSEDDVAALVTPAHAVEAIEACFLRMAAGEVEIAPRRRLRLPEGALADMAASDTGLGLAGGKLYAATPDGTTFVVCLFLITIPLKCYFVMMSIYLTELQWSNVSGKMALAQISDIVFLFVMPFLFIVLIAMALLYIFPEIGLWLPAYLYR